eukprot:851552-Pleurochrysis_carterae.AAC.1
MNLLEAKGQRKLQVAVAERRHFGCSSSKSLQFRGRPMEASAEPAAARPPHDSTANPTASGS